MGRVGTWIGSAALCTVAGVFTMYTTLQPALKELAEKREGTFSEQHDSKPNRDNVISQAIIDDFKEAKREVVDYEKGGFAWGIRKALFGPRQPPADTSNDLQPNPRQEPIPEGKK